MDENVKKARDRIARLCSRREMCRKEVREKLQNWGVDAEHIAKIENWLVESRYVDEERYARAYVRNHLYLRKWGKIKIRTHLKEKQITGTMIDNALSEIPEEEYQEILRTELLKKKKSLKPANRFDLLARLQRFALSRGFETDVVSRVLDDVL